MSLWFRRGSREDPVVLDKRLTAIERQLNISRIVAGGTGTGLIAPATGGGLTSFYAWVAMPGRIRTATAPKIYVPLACTLDTVQVDLTTSSSSGSVTVRLNIGVSDYDTTITSGNTSGSSSPAVSLTAGTLIIPEVTAAGTNAEDMGVLLTFTPT